MPNLHSFTRGLDLDIKAATAAVTLPHHNGRTEGVNTKTKAIKRQMYGRAGFDLLRHRILLGLGYEPSPPKPRQSLQLDKLQQRSASSHDHAGSPAGQQRCGTGFQHAAGRRHDEPALDQSVQRQRDVHLHARRGRRLRGHGGGNRHAAVPEPAGHVLLGPEHRAGQVRPGRGRLPAGSWGYLPGATPAGVGGCNGTVGQVTVTIAVAGSGINGNNVASDPNYQAADNDATHDCGLVLNPYA